MSIPEHMLDATTAPRNGEPSYDSDKENIDPMAMSSASRATASASCQYRGLPTVEPQHTARQQKFTTTAANILLHGFSAPTATSAIQFIEPTFVPAHEQGAGIHKISHVTTPYPCKMI